MEALFFVELLFVLLLSAALSALVLPYISLVAFRRRLFDAVDARKVHSAPIPRLGGLAFFPCIMITLSLVIIAHNLLRGDSLLSLQVTNRLLSLFACLFVLYLIGFMDDLIGVRYRAKFVAQILCGLILIATDLHFDNFYGLFGIYELPAWFGYPFTLLVIVFILNAINLIDGIDGLASGLSIIAFLAFSFMFAKLGWYVYAFVSIASLSVLLPFFYYNVFGKVQRGRKIFMGDTGSLTIGMLLSALTIRLSMYCPVKEVLLPGSIIMAFSFLIVPMLDVVRVVIHRVRLGQSPFKPDRNHIHHKFMALGLSQRSAMISIILLALFYAVANILLTRYISITLLFAGDVLAWTLFNIELTRRIHRRKQRSKLQAQ